MNKKKRQNEKKKTILISFFILIFPFASTSLTLFTLILVAILSSLFAHSFHSNCSLLAFVSSAIFSPVFFVLSSLFFCLYQHHRRFLFVCFVLDIMSSFSVLLYVCSSRSPASVWLWLRPQCRLSQCIRCILHIYINLSLLVIIFDFLLSILLLLLFSVYFILNDIVFFSSLLSFYYFGLMMVPNRRYWRLALLNWKTH